MGPDSQSTRRKVSKPHQVLYLWIPAPLHGPFLPPLCFPLLPAPSCKAQDPVPSLIPLHAVICIFTSLD